MRKRFCLCALAILVLALAGCGGGGDAQPVFEAGILSDQPADGDIAFDPVQQSFTITNGPDTLFFGLDDGDLHLPEYRAFLDFPLDGSTGGDVVPAAARIVSATLEIFIDSVSFASIVPAFLDLWFIRFTGCGWRISILFRCCLWTWISLPWIRAGSCRSMSRL